MRLLVTGGAGFIGSNFIHYVLSQHSDWEITNLDKLTYAGNLENLRDLEDNQSYQFIKGDICNKDLVEKVIEENKIQEVINFAAESHVDRSISGPESFVRTNFFGTFTLLEACRKFGIEKYVQVSTDEVYGSVKEDSFKETDALNPSSPYSASKAAADLLCCSYFKTYNLPVTITRCTNNFGPYQFPEKFIPLAITNLLEGKLIPVYGDGENVRDWIYVEDHCNALDLIVQKGKSGEIYNIAGNCEKKNIDVANSISRIICNDLRTNNHEPSSSIKFVSDRPGHDLRYALNTTKIRQELSWRSQYSFSKALQATINWYINNQPWWRKIKSGEYREYYRRMYSGR